jgi:hypothetical protein
MKVDLLDIDIIIELERIARENNASFKTHELNLIV